MDLLTRIKKFFIDCFDKGYEFFAILNGLGIEYIIEVYLPQQLQQLRKKLSV